MTSTVQEAGKETGQEPGKPGEIGEIKIPLEIEEDRHWWFASRTRALMTLMDAVTPPGGDASILDVGCGAGNMIHHLSRYGRVYGVEIDPRPVAVANERGYNVRQGDAVKGIPFEDASFDLVTTLDTIEHNEEDMAILRECCRVLRPGGYVVVTVPAFMWLWSHNDVINAHVRRYTAGELKEKLEEAGFEIHRVTYNNTLIFPLAAPLIMLRRGNEPELASHHFDEDEYQVEMEPASPPVNAVLKLVGCIEAGLLKWFNLPFGTSIIAVGRRA